MATTRLGNLERARIFQTISSQFPTTTYTGFTVGNDSSNRKNHALLKLDYDNIPAMTDIRNVIVTGVMTGAATGTAFDGGASPTVKIYRMKRDYDPASVTWNAYSTGNNWQTAGGLGADDSEYLGTMSIANVLTTSQVGVQRVIFESSVLAAAIERQIDGTDPAYGFMFVPNVPNGTTFYVNFNDLAYNTYDNGFALHHGITFLHGDANSDSPYPVCTTIGQKTSGTSGTWTIPNTIKDGDMMIVMVRNNLSAAITLTPAGFTSLLDHTISSGTYNGYRMQVWYKFWRDGDGLTLTLDGAGQTIFSSQGCVVFQVIGGVNPDEPFAETPAGIDASPNQSATRYALDLANMTIDNDNSLVIDYGTAALAYNGAGIIYGYTVGGLTDALRTGGGNNLLLGHVGGTSSAAEQGHSIACEFVDAGTRTRCMRLAGENSASRWNAPVLNSPTSTATPIFGVSIVMNPTTTSIPLFIDGAIINIKGADVALNMGYQLAVYDSIINIAGEDVALNQGYQLYVSDALINIAGEDVDLISIGVARWHDAPMRIYGEDVNLIQTHVLAVSGAVLQIRGQDAQVISWEVPEPPVPDWWDEDENAQWLDDDETVESGVWWDDDETQDDWTGE